MSTPATRGMEWDEEGYRCRFCTNYHWGRKRKVNFGNDASRYDRAIAVDRPPPQGV